MVVMVEGTCLFLCRFCFHLFAVMVERKHVCFSAGVCVCVWLLFISCDLLRNDSCCYAGYAGFALFCCFFIMSWNNNVIIIKILYSESNHEDISKQTYRN